MIVAATILSVITVTGCSDSTAPAGSSVPLARSSQTASRLTAMQMETGEAQMTSEADAASNEVDTYYYDAGSMSLLAAPVAASDKKTKEKSTGPGAGGVTTMSMPVLSCGQMRTVFDEHRSAYYQAQYNWALDYAKGDLWSAEDEYYKMQDHLGGMRQWLNSLRMKGCLPRT